METPNANLRKRNIKKPSSSRGESASPTTVEDKHKQDPLQSQPVSTHELTNLPRGGSPSFHAGKEKKADDMQDSSDQENRGDTDSHGILLAKTRTEAKRKVTWKEDMEEPAVQKVFNDKCGTAELTKEVKYDDSKTKSVSDSEHCVEEISNTKNYYVFLILLSLLSLYMRLYNIEIPDHVW